MVDNINIRCHPPISLESAWKTKWWANGQFTFLLSVAEVNAGMARVCAKKAPAKLVLDFWRKLAKVMLENRLNKYGVAPNSPICPRRVSNTPHVIKKRARNEGRYDSELRQFKRVSTVYLARPCSVCRKDTWDYCSCDPLIDLCSACFGAYRAQHCG